MSAKFCSEEFALSLTTLVLSAYYRYPFAYSVQRFFKFLLAMDYGRRKKAC